MKDTIVMVMVILFVHWVGDFVVQTEWEARNKSKSWVALISHTSTYTALWIMFSVFFLTDWGMFWFPIITFVTHTIIDYFTSRLNAKLAITAREKNDYHNFFVSVGFDQFLHYTQLFLTYIFFTKQH